MKATQGKKRNPDGIIRHSRADQIRIAKAFGNPEKRRWLRIGKVGMIGGVDFAEAYALEGTPPRGFIIATPHVVARIGIPSHGQRGTVRVMLSEHLRSEAGKCLCGKLPREPQE